MRGSTCLLLVFAASCTCGREVTGSACDSSNPCVQSTFNQATGKCVAAPLADGTSCDAGLECLTNTRCAAGACVGEPRSCDDQNACTSDACVEGQGCQHTPVICGADDPCHLYACNPASGCYDTSDTLPDGTACKLWWEPCVDDAACAAGVCDSPTADKEVPGQVRWQVDLDWPIGPFTIDDAGTSTYLAIPDGGQQHELVAIDGCGKVLWSTTTGVEVFGVVQDTDQLVAWGVSGTFGRGDRGWFFGLDPSTGVIRWTLNEDLTMAAIAEDAGVPGAGYCVDSGADMQAVALTDQHSVRAIVHGCDPALWSIDHEGHLLWSASLPYQIEPPWSPVVDAAGNTYVPTLSSQPCNGMPGPDPVLWEVSATGQTVMQEILPTWQPAGYCQSPYSVYITLGARGVVIQPSYLLRGIWDGGDLLDREGAGLLVPFDGGAFASLPLVNLGDEAATLTTLVDASGEMFMPGILSDAGFAGMTLVAPTGEPRWSSTAITLGNLVLADDGSVFGLQANADDGYPAAIVELDADGGTVVWTSAFLAAYSGGGSPSPSQLALSPGASLLTNNGTQAIAIFAGKHRPSTTAPWSRWGGDNSNRSSAR